MSQTTDKPWGQELILTTPDLPYAAKILKIKAHQRLSLQSHDQKTETLVLFSGQAKITLGDQTQDMEILKPYTILPDTVHRISTITDASIFEASTPEQGTTKRLEDDYQRSNETPAVRNSPNRGWPQN